MANTRPIAITPPVKGSNTRAIFKMLDIVAPLERPFVTTFNLLQPRQDEQPLPNLRLIVRRIELGVEELEKQPANSPGALASQNLRRELTELAEKIKKYLDEEKRIHQTYEEKRPKFFAFLNSVKTYLQGELPTRAGLPPDILSEEKKIIADQTAMHAQIKQAVVPIPTFVKQLNALETRVNATTIELGVRRVATP